MKRIFWGVFWSALIVAGLWALMNFSTSKSNLEPYTKFKKTASAAKNDNPSQPLNVEKVSAESNRNPLDLIKQAAAFDEPRSGLPRETLEQLRKGIELTELEKHNQADLEFAKAAKLSPNSPEVFSIWATALRKQKKYKGANRKFARALELAPDDSEIVFNWGVSSMEEHNSAEAVRLLKKTLQLDPNHFLAYNYLGKSYGQKKMYKKEIEAYEKSIAINPEFGLTRFNLGVVLSLQKRFDDAVPHFEKAIALDKSFAKPFVVQFLTAMGRANPLQPAPLKPVDKKPVQEAKADLSKKEEKPAEGSGHKMEGAKGTKDMTQVTGKVLINGKALNPRPLIMLETKNKLKVKDQKVLSVTIRQSDLNFFPRHTIVPIGSTVIFENNDREVHNIYSKSNRNQFNLGAMAAGPSRSIDFTQAGPVVLRCNLHKDMVGTLFIVPNGYYTQADDRGNFSFDAVKSQGYILQVWHPSLDPAVVEANMQSLELKGEDQTLDLDIKSASSPNEIHDLTDPTDYKAIVKNIEREMFQAIEDWKNGKKFMPRKRMLMAVTKHYEGEGLKGAIAKSFSEKRSMILEKKLDSLRKKISGIGISMEELTEESLKKEATAAVASLRKTVKELEARLKPVPMEMKKE